MPGFWETITKPFKKAGETVASWFARTKEPTPEGYRPFKKTPVETVAQLFGLGKRPSAIRETIEKPRETMEEFLKRGEEKKLKETIEKGKKPPGFWYYFPRELGKETFATTLEIAESLIKAPFKITKTFAYHPLYYHEKEPEWKVPGLGQITSYAEDTIKRQEELLKQGLDEKTATIATILGVGSEAILDVAIVASWIESGAKAVARKYTPKLHEKVAAWKLLGEPKSPAQLNQNWRQLAHQFHPDKIGGRGTAMKEINKAYTILNVKGGLPTAKELLTAKAARIGIKATSPISKIMELPKPKVVLPFKMLPERAGYVPEEAFKPYYKPAMGLSIKPTPMKPVVTKAKEGVKTIVKYELPAELMPVRGKPTWKHSKILWNTMRNQYGQTNKIGKSVTDNRGTVAWIIDTLEGGKKELAPLTEKYVGQAMSQKQYKKLYAMFKAHDYDIEGYKKVMATLKGIEPIVTEIAPAKAVAKIEKPLPMVSTKAAQKITPQQTEKIAKMAEKTQPVPKTLEEKQLELINKKATPVVKAGKETAPKQMRLDEVKPAPPGEPPKPPEEIPLAIAPPPPEGSGLEAIDKMVGKIGRVRGIWERMKELPRSFTKLFTDRFSGIKNFESNVSKLAGKPIDINSSPYVAARNYAGRIGTVEMNLRDLQRILNPLRKQRADFTRYTLSKRAIERASRGFKNPAGVTGEQATRALAEIKTKVGDATYKTFEATEKAIQDWADKAILKPALESGIISKNAYEAIVTKNKHWMPFQVLDYLPSVAEADMIAVGSETFSVSKQGIIKALKGTEKTIRDPFAAIIDRLSESVSLTKRNEVAKKLIALRKEFPAAKELIKPLARVSKEIDKATGKKKLIWDLRPPKDWNSISVFINGKVTKWAVPTDLGQAMHAMNPVQAGFMGGLLKVTSSAFRRGATSLYIPFSLSNAFRDLQMAVLCSKWGFNPADWLKGFGAGLKGSFGWESKLYNDFMRNQGGFGGFIQSARAISGARKALFEPSWWRKTKAVINPLNLISNFAEAVELAPRLGVYRKGIKKGVTTLEAAFEARRVTIDFARSGQEARIINMWIPFVNARWQALLNTVRVFKDHPVRSAARTIGLVMIPGITTYLWNTLHYPDLYDDIPQWAKDTYFILIVGEEIDERGNRVPRIVQIPKGDVGQIFYNPLEYALEYVRKGEPQNHFKLALEWMSQLSPIPFTRDGEPSATSFLSGALPPAIRTPIELATNECFFMGYPIVPRRLEKVAPSEQYDERTPELAITISRALGISPMKLAYGVGGLLGGFGREALDPAKILDLTVKRFYRTSGGAKRNEAWNLLDDLTVGYNTVRVQAKKAIEQGQLEAANALIEEWNRKAESVIPDITAFIAEDDPKEAESIAKKVTFQSSDIKRLKKTVQEEIAEIKKTPSETPTREYWGAEETAPPTMGELFPAQPTEKVTAGYWK